MLNPNFYLGPEVAHGLSPASQIGFLRGLNHVRDCRQENTQ